MYENCHGELLSVDFKHNGIVANMYYTDNNGDSYFHSELYIVENLQEFIEMIVFKGFEISDNAKKQLGL
jgi:hypothetical protein